MERKFDEDQIKDIVKQTLILLVSLMLIIGFFKLFYSYSSQRKMISEFENTNIREKLITNNKVANMGKPYKIKDGIVYMPLLELCKNFNTDATYKFTPNGGIELKYRKSTFG